LAVLGNGKGATHIFGNAGWFNLPAGRFPLEEICQFRNVMLRMLKGTNRIWVGIPDGIHLDYDRNIAFADLGSDVYIALVPYNALSVSSNTLAYDSTYNQYIWNYDPTQLGALALEVGTASDYTNYANFKAAISAVSTFTSLGPDKINYLSSSAHLITAQYVPPISYRMETGQLVNPSGTTPMAWGDSTFIDYNAFNSYEVSFGERIIHQAWGDGTLHLSCNGNALKISINDSTALPAYLMAKNVLPQFVTTSKTGLVKSQTMTIFPNPGNNKAYFDFTVVKPTTLTLTITDQTGREIIKVPDIIAQTAGKQQYCLDLGPIPNGVYNALLSGHKFLAREKLVVWK
jgi:hypothetical protein